jgi:two-component system chemotaxis sensor kinase CheA
VAQGILAAAQAQQLGRDQLLPLIYRSGISTSEQLSNVSGRGLGMSIGREGVERLGGTIGVETRDGGGTTFRIVLPLSLATFRVLLVEVGGQTLALPTGNTDRVLRLAAAAVESVDGRDAIAVGDERVLFERLERALGMEGREPDAGERILAVVLRSGERRAAFRVDRVLDEQEVLAKGVGSYLQRVRHFSGATILGTGRVVPIVNVAELIETVRARLEGPVVVVAEPVVPHQVERPRSVLVVEDSITSRMLLKEILESAGYVVTTAINGAEGIAVLERQEFDLVVSDVEMPRMNGFELTAAIRADPRWRELPVILVTGLEREAERKRGFDAGASEYIVKGSFEQSNLLSAVRRLCGES